MSGFTRFACLRCGFVDAESSSAPCDACGGPVFDLDSPGEAYLMVKAFEIRRGQVATRRMFLAAGLSVATWGLLAIQFGMFRAVRPPPGVVEREAERAQRMAQMAAAD